MTSFFQGMMLTQGEGSRRHLKIAEVANDVSILVLVALVFEVENGRDELGQTKELRYDGISPGNDPEDRLPARVVLREEVHHGHKQHWGPDDPAGHERREGHLTDSDNRQSELSSTSSVGRSVPDGTKKEIRRFTTKCMLNINVLSFPTIIRTGNFCAAQARSMK